MPSEIARAVRERTWVAVVSFDIDHFKLVNDDWGHEEGDRALVRLADVFRRETRGNDVVGRMGGEEFIALGVLGPRRGAELCGARTGCLRGWEQGGRTDAHDQRRGDGGARPAGL